MSNLLFGSKEHQQASELALSFINRYQSQLAEQPVFPSIDRSAINSILEAPLPEKGVSLEQLFQELEELVVPNSTHTAHPRFLPYVQPSPNGISPYAELIAADLNQNCNLWTLSPAANAIEQTVIRWFTELFQFTQTAGGLVTSGGSMANLIGMTLARDRALGERARSQGLQGATGKLTLYMSDQTHSSIDKAARLLGLGTESLRKIPSDDRMRIRVDHLNAAVEQDEAIGNHPCCVIANAGTVASGAVDPIGALADLCTAHDLWLHVDGAYGALGILSSRSQPELEELRRADSLSLDPHKLLFTSFEAGCLLVQEPERLRHSFSSSPSYLNIEQDASLINYADYGPQLSRSFKALKIWWSLRHFGRKAYTQAIDRLMDLAQHMSRSVESSSCFELLAPTTFNAVCFRLINQNDAENSQVLRILVESGYAFLGPIVLDGRFGFRACFMNLRTTEEDIRGILAKLEEIAGSLPSAKAESGQ